MYDIYLINNAVASNEVRNFYWCCLNGCTFAMEIGVVIVGMNSKVIPT